MGEEVESMEGIYTLEVYRDGVWVVVGEGRWSQMERLAQKQCFEVGCYFISESSKSK